MTNQSGAAVAAQRGPDIERHEAVHSRQRARYARGEIFISSYSAQSLKSGLLTWGDPAKKNKFEMEANLWWGSYE
ncbi:hypothetical protein [Streptomyces venezuelae]|uniref:hypothetical protein n=1 Tax=Streptomyces venezuelae TaxID=54571 RepID=UPI001238B236|nr:hypothetical protein [Streptomyces venezuelae]